MRIFLRLLRKNIPGQVFILLLSCLFALLSVHSIALVQGALIPYRAIQSRHYDHSYYLSSKQFMLPRERFQSLIKGLGDLEAYEGADYIYYLRDTWMEGEGPQRHLRFCSRHMAGAFGLDLRAYELPPGQFLAIGASSQGDEEIEFTNSEERGRSYKARVLAYFSENSPQPVYHARYHIGSAQLIYRREEASNTCYVFAENLDEQLPEDVVIYPTKLSVFFSRPLEPEEEAQFFQLVEQDFLVTPVSEMRQNTRQKMVKSLSRSLPQPILAGFILWSSLLSITLLGTYKTRPVYRILRQLGMTRRRLGLFLILPLFFHGAVATGLYLIYTFLLNYGFFNQAARYEEGAYEPGFVLYFALIYVLFILVALVFLKLIIRQDERRASVL